MPEDDYSMSGYQFPRRMRNVFPSPAEGSFDPAQGFDPSTFNKSALGGFQPFGSSYYNPYQQQQQQDSDYESTYEPSSTLKRYLSLSQSKPQREDYKPSGWGKALATAAGAVEGWRGGPNKGIASAQAVRDMPYARAMQDYESEYESAASALKSEQQESQLKSMAGYRSGQLTEKAADRIRKEAYDKARTDTANKKIGSTELMFGQKLEVDSATQKAQQRHYEEIDRINNDLKNHKISNEEHEFQLDQEIRRQAELTRSRFAGAAERQAGAAESRADSYGDYVENEGNESKNKPIPMVEPSARKTADELARGYLMRNKREYRQFFDSKGNLRPPGEWTSLPGTKKLFTQLLDDLEKQTESYLATPKPQQSTAPNAAGVTPPRTAGPQPVRKTGW